jgi:hypothetical protein
LSGWIAAGPSRCHDVKLTGTAKRSRLLRG